MGETPHRTLDDHAHSMNLGMKLFLMPEYHAFRRKFRDGARPLPHETVLDFGCGVGLLEDFFGKPMRAPGRIVGVDIGFRLLRKAKRRWPAAERVHFVQIAASGSLPLKSASVDLIVSNLVIHLLSRPQKQAVFREFRRLLKPDGRLMMAEFGKPYNWHGRLQVAISRHVYMRLWPYEINSLDSYDGLVPTFLEEAGFSVRIIDRLKGYIDFLQATPRA